MVGKRARSTLPIVNTLPITARARVKAFALGSATWPRERGRPLEEPGIHVEGSTGFGGLTGSGGSIYGGQDPGGGALMT